jgi:hypothetical protein
MAKTRRGGDMINEVSQGMPAPPSAPIRKSSPTAPPSVEPSSNESGPMYGPVKRPPVRPRGRPTLGGKTSRWTRHVKKTMRANKGKTFRAVMKLAKKTYGKRI